MKSTGQPSRSRAGQSVEAGSHTVNTVPTSPTLSRRASGEAAPSLDSTEETMTETREAIFDALEILDEAIEAARRSVEGRRAGAGSYLCRVANHLVDQLAEAS